MKKLIALSLSLILCFCAVFASAEAPTMSQNGQQQMTEPPAKPAGEQSGTTTEPPAKPVGEQSGTMTEPPAKPDGEQSGTMTEPPAMPDGEQQGGMGGMGGQPGSMDGQQGGMDGQQGGMGGQQGSMGGQQSSANISYTAVNELTEDATLTGTIESTGTDENAILVSGGTVTVTAADVTRTSSDSTGGDNASFYGVGAAILATGGTVTISDSTISTDAKGGAGVFAYGSGTAYVSDTVIETKQDTSGGIHVAGGGTLYASNLTVTTYGGSSAAIRSDRGGGTMTVEGGSYTSNGTGSPAVYVTADISVSDAILTANNSEAICLEGKNSLTLTDCTLTGSMHDDSQNDNTWTVILYQSMSGDSEEGLGTFTMQGGKLISTNGGLFYTTNTSSEFTLENVEIEQSADSEYFLRCTGNSNQRGWGSAGNNGATCTFTAIAQQMNGDILWDSVSELTLNITEGSVLTGAVLDDESCAGNGGSGSCSVTIDASSQWIVTGSSTLTTLNCAGTIADAAGNSVTVQGTDGTVYVNGTSEFTITVSEYNK